MNNNTHPCAGKCRRFKEGRQCSYCLINETLIQGVYLIYRTEHQIDHIVEPNEMGDDAHIGNNISPLCVSKSSKSDSQIIAELKAENKMLHEAAATHLKNQMHFKKLYDALVEQLYPYALSLDEPVDSSVNAPKEFINGYDRARECAHYNLLEMMKSNEEYIKSQCGMLGGGEA